MTLAQAQTDIDEGRYEFKDADAHDGPRIFVVIVGVVDAVTVRGNESKALPSAAASIAALTTFWCDIATNRDVQTFGGAVRCVSVFPLRPTGDHRYHSSKLLGRLAAAASGAQPEDRIVLHWVGHGARVPGQDDNCLYLAERSAPDDGVGGEPDTIFVRRVIRRFLATCGAAQQFFFFDVCGKVDPMLDWLAGADRTITHPDDKKRPRPGNEAYAVVASGKDGIAVSPAPDQPSLFTQAFKATLNSYPSSISGELYPASSFLKAIAGHIRSAWLASRAKDHPHPGYRMPWPDNWYRKYVREVYQDGVDMLSDSVVIGRTRDVRMQTFFGAWDAHPIEGATIAYEQFSAATIPMDYPFPAGATFTALGLDVPLSQKAASAEVALTLRLRLPESQTVDVKTVRTFATLPVAQRLFKRTELP